MTIFNRLSCISILVILAFSHCGCRTIPAAAPVKLDDPGWIVKQGQATWTPSQAAAAQSGEIIAAFHPDGRGFVCFSKTPLTLVTAQFDSSQWQAQFAGRNKVYRGSGAPPRRLMWAYLPYLVGGKQLPAFFTSERLPESRWRLTEAKSGQVIEGYFEGDAGSK